MALHGVIRDLIDDHLSGVLGADADRQFLEEASAEFYIVTVAETKEQLAQHFRSAYWNPQLDELCARIAFLRASNALSRRKMGKSWRPARSMSREPATFGADHPTT
jgi:hypothetical protein